jgi:hypothetical protein
VRARRILWALWITLTVLWVCASIWPLVLSVFTCFHKSDPVVRQVCNDHPFPAYGELTLGFGPPIAVLLIGFIGFRMASRFKSAKS